MTDASRHHADVAIVGGGPAGAAAATMLARSGRRVVVFERRRLPAHRLCGEFLSYESERSLARLGVAPALAESAHPVRRARIVGRSGASVVTHVPDGACGVSRYALDEALLATAAEAGARVCAPTVVGDIAGSLADGFEIAAGDATWRAGVVLGAWGRRDRLDARLGRPHIDRRGGHVAFKRHVEGTMPDEVALFLATGGYCGAAPVGPNRVNLCWIASAQRFAASGRSADALLGAMAAENAALGTLLGELGAPCSPLKAVAEVSFEMRATSVGDVLMVGDAAGMIAPFCGDGMSMALDGGMLAADIVDGFLAGAYDPATLKTAYHRAWRQRFRTRMRLGRVLQAAAERPAASAVAIGACRRLPALTEWVLRRTRA